MCTPGNSTEIRFERSEKSQGTLSGSSVDLYVFCFCFFSLTYLCFVRELIPPYRHKMIQIDWKSPKLFDCFLVLQSESLLHQNIVFSPSTPISVRTTVICPLPIFIDLVLSRFSLRVLCLPLKLLQDLR